MVNQSVGIFLILKKLDFLGDIVPYYNYQEAEKVCNILNGVSYILKGDVK